MEGQNSSNNQNDIESISDCPGIILREDTDVVSQDVEKPQKRPKRILRFSDGEMVEYSSEDEADAPKANSQVAATDPKTLNWGPWAWYQTVMVGSKLLNGCDYVGEALADFLGITSPKYQFEIDEYKRLQAMQDQESRKQDLEMGGWNKRFRNNVITKPEVTDTV